MNIKGDWIKTNDLNISAIIKYFRILILLGIKNICNCVILILLRRVFKKNFFFTIIGVQSPNVVIGKIDDEFLI